MNVHRNTHTKAVLNEARLQRFKQALLDNGRLEIPYQSFKLPTESKSPIDTVPFGSSSSGDSKQAQNEASCPEVSRHRRLTFVSGNRLTGRRFPRAPRRNNILSTENTFASSETIQNLNQEMPNDVTMILHELKQIKKKITAEMELKSELKDGIVPLSLDKRRRIHSFMNACDMVLESFEKELHCQRSDTELRRVDQRRTKRQIIKEANSSKKIVRFDLCRNEFFYF